MIARLSCLHCLRSLFNPLLLAKFIAHEARQLTVETWIDLVNQLKWLLANYFSIVWLKPVCASLQAWIRDVSWAPDQSGAQTSQNISTIDVLIIFSEFPIFGKFVQYVRTATEEVFVYGWFRWDGLRMGGSTYCLRVAFVELAQQDQLNENTQSNDIKCTYTIIHIYLCYHSFRSRDHGLTCWQLLAVFKPPCALAGACKVPSWRLHSLRDSSCVPDALTLRRRRNCKNLDEDDKMKTSREDSLKKPLCQSPVVTRRRQVPRSDSERTW